MSVKAGSGSSPDSISTLTREHGDKPEGLAFSLIDELISDFDQKIGGYLDTYWVRAKTDVPCRECRGSGRKVGSPSTPCESCNGNGSTGKTYSFEFNAPKNQDDMSEYYKACSEWVIKMLDPEVPPHPNMQRAIEGLGNRDLVIAFTLSYWAVNKTDLNQLAALSLCHRPALAGMFIEALNKRFSAGYTVSAMAEIEAKKKD